MRICRLAKYDDSPQTSPLLTSRLAHQSSSSNVFSRLTTSASASDDNSRYHMQYHSYLIN